MRKQQKILIPVLFSLLAAACALVLTISPTLAQDVARIRTEIRQELTRLGIIDASGANAAALGPSSSVDSHVSVFSGTTGKVLDDRPVTVASTGQLSWPTGLGAIEHAKGPSDNPLVFQAGAGQTLHLRDANGATRVNVSTTGVALGGATTFSASPRPTSDLGTDLGTSGVRFANGYFGTAIYVAGNAVPSVLHKSVTSAQTGNNTDETTLWSYSLPAGTLASDGQAVRITAFGTFAANANTKTINLKFGGTTLRQFSSTFNNQTWVMTGEVFRTGATAQFGTVRGQTGATSAPAVLTTPGATLANAVTIELTGQNGTASDGDIVFRSAVVEFLP